jgi:CHAT domain-containing protein
VRAVLEALNAFLRHEPLYVVPGRAAEDGEQPIFHLGPAQPQVAAPAPADAAVTAASRRLAQTEWKYVERVVRGETVSFQQVVSRLAPGRGAALLEFYVTEHGTVTYLITGGQAADASSLPVRTRPAVLETFCSPALTLKRLTELLFEESPAWMPAQKQWLEAGTQTAFTTWKRAMDRVLGVVREALFEPLAARLKELGVGRLLLVPHRGLHVIPLHALSWETGGGEQRYLLLDYDEIVYAPSSTLAFIALDRHDSARQALGLNAVAVADSSRKLPYSAYEVECVAERFPPAARQVLRDRAATRPNVQTLLPQPYFHFSGHAHYSVANPLDSALELMGGRLTAGELFEEALALQRTRLVCLAACETGMADPEDVADEHIGLAGGFLFTGTAAVVSSLWPVPDVSSALLIDKLYEFHLPAPPERPESRTVGAALLLAQKWVRGATVAQVREHFSRERPPVSAPVSEAVRQKLQERFPENLDATSQPFAHPYYWGGFTVSSAPTPSP